MQHADGRNPVIENAPATMENSRRHQPIEVVLESEANDADQRVESPAHSAIPSKEVRNLFHHGPPGQRRSIIAPPRAWLLGGRGRGFGSRSNRKVRAGAVPFGFAAR